MKMYKYFLLVISLISIMACGTTPEVSDANITAASLDKYLAEISSDYYQGRKPFTEGEKRTLDYLETQLKEIGVAPGNGDSYFQEVPLVEITGSPDKTMTLKGHGEEIELELGSDFVSYTERIQDEINVEESEVVFCGFGITAPEYGWNDFEGMDVKGKTVVVLVNDPGFGSDDASFFKGNTMTYYGRWTYKYEEAARQGAEALLIIHETTSAGYPWFVVESSWSGSALHLRSPDGNKDKAAVQGWITLDVAKELFEKSGKDLGAEIRKARTRDFEPFSLGYTMSHSLTNTFKNDVSQNVAGLIKGNERPDEYIIYSAHWDHLGIGQAVDGDSIYNGAVDNGTGIASLLSIAEVFAQGPPPARSVLFLFVTAEEQGLLGSQYYGENPIYPPNMTVANLNMDGMNPFGPMKYLTVTGIGHSDLDEYAEEAAAAQGREILPDQEPEKGYFFRSDHFNFAKVGIPALYAEGSLEHMEKGRDYVKEQRQGYLDNRYHQPADHYDPETWDLGGLVQDAKLYYNVGQRLASESTFPKWKEGSEFKAIREESMMKN